MRARRTLAVLLSLLAAGRAAAQVVSERPDKVAVVLYQDRAPSGSYANPEYDDGDPGLAVVSERRTVDLRAGRSRILMRGVAEGMVPQTAAIEGLDGRLVERNYDFDLLTPGKLIEKAVGQSARLVRTEIKTGRETEEPVTIRSGPRGIVLQHADGSAEALGCSGAPERLVFDSAPAGLSADPTLSAVVEAPRAGRYVLTLTYLTQGLRWSADYVARVDPGGRTLHLGGWLTLSNLGGTTFGDAPTQVVAGRLALVEGEDQAPEPADADEARTCWPTAPVRIRGVEDVAVTAYRNAPSPRSNALEEVIVTATRQASVSNLGDYKIYTLPEPTTVAARQTKQVAFLAQQAVPFERIYSYRAQPFYSDPDTVQSAQVLLRMQNKSDQGLGQPLPGGQVTIFEPRPNGGVILAGQPRIRDTPKGLKLELAEVNANPITVQALQGDSRTIPLSGGASLERSQVTLTVRNGGSRPARVEIRLDQASLKVLSETRPHVRDGRDMVWALDVPAEGEQTLGYRTEQH